MDKDKMLEKYKRRLRVEAIIKSLIFGVAIGLIVICLLSLFFFIGKSKNIPVTLIVGGVVMAITAYLIYKSKYKPTINGIAKRIDELGLDERVITMVDYSGKDDNYMIQKQREDALQKLEKVDEKEIKYNISLPSIVCLVICALLALSSMFLPKSNVSANPLNPSNPSESISDSVISDSQDVSEEVDKIIDDMLDDLRDIIDKAEVDDELKEQLNGKVDQLEEELKQDTTIEEKIAAIEKAEQEIKDIIEEALTKIVLGKALQEFEYTKDLGIAIENSILAKVDSSMDELKNILNESTDYNAFLNELVSNLNTALQNAVDEQNDALIEAVTKFAESLNLIKDNTDEVTTKQEALEIIEIAKEEIKAALQQQDEMEDMGEDMQDSMQNASDSLKDIIDREQGKEDPTKPDEPSTSETPSSGDGQDSGSNSGDTSDSLPPPPIFDNDSIGADVVIDGSTPYLDVYEQYYEEIMQYLAGEDIPDDIREIIERYLEMLK